MMEQLQGYGDLTVFKVAAVCHLGFSKMRNFNGRSAVRGQFASQCQISSESVKQLQRYGNLTVVKPAAVRHLGVLKLKIVNGHGG